MKILYTLILAIALYSCGNNSESSSASDQMEEPSKESTEDTNIETQGEAKSLSEISNDSEPTTETSSETSTAPKDNEALIEDIRTNFAQINNWISEDKCNIIHRSYECPDYPEYATIKYYEYENKIVMIEHTYNDGSHGGYTDQYYLQDNKAFFAFMTGGYWRFDGEDENGNPKTVDINTEERFYIANDNLIRCLSKQFQSENQKDFATQRDNAKNVTAKCDPKTLIEINSKVTNLISFKDMKFIKPACFYDQFK